MASCPNTSPHFLRIVSPLSCLLILILRWLIMGPASNCVVIKWAVPPPHFSPWISCHSIGRGPLYLGRYDGCKLIHPRSGRSSNLCSIRLPHEQQKTIDGSMSASLCMVQLSVLISATCSQGMSQTRHVSSTKFG